MKTYFGVISEIVDNESYPKDLYVVKVNIPGKNAGVKAFPTRSVIDEPRVGDVVFLREIDPQFHSYYLYEKLKENEFIGIRSRGKVIRFTEDNFEIFTINPSDESWYDNTDSTKDPTPEPLDWVRMDKDGNLDIKMRSGATVSIGGDCTIEVGGNCSITAGGDTTVESPNVTVTGGSLTVNGSVAPGSGPFCAIPNCIFSGAPHGGNKVSGT